MHIDWWTLAFQTVNVLVLIWILARFFFRPLGDIVAKRQAQANKVLAEALAARQQADDSRADADKTRAEIDAERDRLIAEALKAAQLEKASLLAQSLDEIARLRGAAEAAIVRDQSAAKQAIVARASELSVEIAQRLLARLPPSAALSRVPRRALPGAAGTVIRRKGEPCLGRGRSCKRRRDCGTAFERRNGTRSRYAQRGAWFRAVLQVPR
jgi:F0F1-type ATP synthase membrane subunit b/b'